MRFTRVLAISIMALAAYPASASSNTEKLVSIIHNSGQQVSATTLNRAMVQLMQARDASKEQAQLSRKDTTCQAAAAAGNCLARLAPAAGQSAPGSKH